jgi:signal-transduction protein with cAMP-binding, CBS, and nucleotidyltransferase domain
MHRLVQQDHELVDVCSARDLRRSAHPANATQNRLVADVMTPRVLTVEPGTSVHRADNLTRGRSIGCLIVTEAGRAVRILTVARLLDQISGPRRHRRNKQTPPARHYRLSPRSIAQAAFGSVHRGACVGYPGGLP